jgi:hypothetical protein
VCVTWGQGGAEGCTQSSFAHSSKSPSHPSSLVLACSHAFAGASVDHLWSMNSCRPCSGVSVVFKCVRSVFISLPACLNRRQGSPPAFMHPSWSSFLFYVHMRAVSACLRVPVRHLLIDAAAGRASRVAVQMRAATECSVRVPVRCILVDALCWRVECASAPRMGSGGEPGAAVIRRSPIQVSLPS